MNATGNNLTQRLQSARPAVLSSWCIVAAFGTYFCMYAFRKPFTAGTFDVEGWETIGYKVLLIAAQVAGYTLSKFIGIKFVSEMPRSRRAVSILFLIGWAELALLLFAIVPVSIKPFMLFLNGLPLGMVFGLVLAFLEGRRATEALTAGLCASFIVSSGVVKSIGRSLIHDWHVSEFLMPFATGAIFIVPLLFFVWMLTVIPPPSREDVASRSERTPMNGAQRSSFFRRHAFGICGMLATYTLLTIMRSMRDDFGVEIWNDLGYTKTPSIYAWSEMWVALGVTAINGAAISIKNNRNALLGTLLLICGGFVVVIATLIGFWQGIMSPFAFMVIVGTGMYIPYVAFHTTVFERMIAVFREPGNIGYLMYMADSIGYLGYVAVMVLHHALTHNTTVKIDFLQLFMLVSLIIASVSLVIMLEMVRHFRQRLPIEEPQPHVEFAESN